MKLRLPRKIAGHLAAPGVENRDGDAVGPAGEPAVAVDEPEAAVRPVVEGHALDQAGAFRPVDARLVAESEAVLDAAGFLDRPGHHARIAQPHQSAAEHADHPDAAREPEKAQPDGAHGGELVVPVQLAQAVQQRNQQRQRQDHREVTRQAHGIVDGDVAAASRHRRADRGNCRTSPATAAGRASPRGRGPSVLSHSRRMCRSRMFKDGDLVCAAAGGHRRSAPSKDSPAPEAKLSCQSAHATGSCQSRRRSDARWHPAGPLHRASSTHSRIPARSASGRCGAGCCAGRRRRSRPRQSTRRRCRDRGSRPRRSRAQRPGTGERAMTTPRAGVRGQSTPRPAAISIHGRYERQRRPGRMRQQPVAVDRAGKSRRIKRLGDAGVNEDGGEDNPPRPFHHRPCLCASTPCAPASFQYHDIVEAQFAPQAPGRRLRRITTRAVAIHHQPRPRPAMPWPPRPSRRLPDCRRARGLPECGRAA